MKPQASGPLNDNDINVDNAIECSNFLMCIFWLYFFGSAGRIIIYN